MPQGAAAAVKEEEEDGQVDEWVKVMCSVLEALAVYAGVTRLQPLRWLMHMKRSCPRGPVAQVSHN
jgi:hypothetical protein